MLGFLITTVPAVLIAVTITIVFGLEGNAAVMNGLVCGALGSAVGIFGGVWEYFSK